MPVSELLGNVTLNRLNSIFESVMKKREDRKDPVRANFGKIEKEEINTEEKMSYIRNYACSHQSFSFRALLEKSSSRQEIIVTFLIILEMMKTGEFTVSQDDINSDMIIKVNRVA